ncbi:hypothetical protein VST63_22920 [Mycolicibacterium sp. 050232]|uniref:hypothetical protein n=1 Tax=Mycolicibacterium sp. 050232 TaxID=3113982 RepID=UPI002E2E59A2|nr:hypothetical protein [Mycolicibacterium sp. 050232]MED5815223.1 hypothetical protein [Mycolicibacterium sp. 050232]
MTDSAWELRYRELKPASRQLRSEHDTREEAVGRLTDYLVDAGITLFDDPSMADRNKTIGDFRATFTTTDGNEISYVICEVKRPDRYLSQSQVEEYLKLARGSLSRIKLPPPDAVIGPINEDGTVPRGSIRGWLRETIDEWQRNRPGRGSRTDLQ